RLNKDLLRSVEEPEAPPNPSVHLALRLSAHHNLAMENQHLTRLKTQLHQNLQRILEPLGHAVHNTSERAVTGQLALYVLALRSSCHDLTSLTLSDGDAPEHLLSHLKRQLEREKEHIACELSRRPLTTYYQYSLGMLALCVGGVRVSAHVSHKLIHAVNHGLIKHGDSAPIGELTRSDPVRNEEDLEKSLTNIKQKLLDSQRADGHLGNQFSTGLVLQVSLTPPRTDLSALRPNQTSYILCGESF
uniref:Transcobalamin II n=1 Tax=Astyanax mexicanus TaxID=7994 RepID=A0A3B1JVG0_ASTMX